MINSLTKLALATCLALMLAGCEQAADPVSPGRSGKPPSKLVAVNIAERQLIRSQYQRSGILQHRRLVHIYNQEEGRVDQLTVFEGDLVEKGDLLAKLDDQLLQAEHEKARATTHQAKVNLDRIIDLDKRQVASQDELTRAKTALEVARAEEKILAIRIGFANITAPFSGIITERLVEPGDIKSRHSHLLTLADPASLITEVTVSELLLPNLYQNQPVKIRIDALGSQNFSGEISRIHPTLDPVTHHGKLEIKLDPVPDGTRAGQFVRVTLETEPVPRLMIPFHALHRDREGEYLYIHRQGKAIRQPVVSGIHIDDNIEVIEGIESGDQVITQGFLGLRDGKPVKVISSDPSGNE